jgi:hypothetical protein
MLNLLLSYLVIAWHLVALTSVLFHHWLLKLRLKSGVVFGEHSLFLVAVFGLWIDLWKLIVEWKVSLVVWIWNSFLSLVLKSFLYKNISWLFRSSALLSSHRKTLWLEFFKIVKFEWLIVHIGWRENTPPFFHLLNGGPYTLVMLNDDHILFFWLWLIK